MLRISNTRDVLVGLFMIIALGPRVLHPLSHTFLFLHILSNWNRRDFVLDIYCSFIIRTAAFVRGRSRCVVTNAVECRTCDPCDEFYFAFAMKYVSGVSFKTSCDFRIRVACVWVRVCEVPWKYQERKYQLKRGRRLRKGIRRRRSNFEVSFIYLCVQKILCIKIII